MSILFVARWRSARSMIEWMCTQERWNPEVAIIFGAAARYRPATVGSSLDDAHPDNSTQHTGAVRPHTGFVARLFFISPRIRRADRTRHQCPCAVRLLTFFANGEYKLD
jgi:hypothetical protein